MQSKEGRIIALGMLAGALCGGTAVLLMRARNARETGSDPEPLAMLMDRIHWAEVMSIAVAGIALARRIGNLIEPPADSAA